MFIDTHAHIWWDSYRDDITDVIARAKTAGVEALIVPGTDLITSQQAVELARLYPGYVYAAVGIHPEETIHKTLAVTKNALMFNGQMKRMRELIDHNRQYIVAVGEIGTDANTDELRASMTNQMNLFREQCEIACEYELPVIVHTRKSWSETLAVLDSLETMPSGQFHCFSYDVAEIDEALRRGFYISFCGNITWSKRVQRASLSAPLERLVLETDSPFMMPRDDSGEPLNPSLRNEPQNVTMLAEFQANLRNENLAEFARQTTANVKKLFTL